MSSPWEDIRRESMEIPAVGRAARPSPLPWMLLTVSIVLTVIVLMLGRSRLDDERVRTANALKANDELHKQLKEAVNDLDASRTACTQADESTGELRKQLVGLELTNRRLQTEIRAQQQQPAKKGGKK